MKVISVLNHKGGVGKSTIATNLAAYYANQNYKVLLGDFDEQQSSQNWLGLRPETAAPIYTWDIVDAHFAQPPEDTTHIVIDCPAGIKSIGLQKIVAMSDKVVVPLKPGIFDLMSTQTFLGQLCELINAQDKETELCIVGNMTDTRTKSTEQLKKFIESTNLPCPTYLRQGQIYVNLAAYGLSIFDNKPSILSIFSKDLVQWKYLTNWLEK